MLATAVPSPVITMSPLVYMQSDIPSTDTRTVVDSRVSIMPMKRPGSHSISCDRRASGTAGAAAIGPVAGGSADVLVDGDADAGAGCPGGAGFSTGRSGRRSVSACGAGLAAGSMRTGLAQATTVPTTPTTASAA